MLTPNLTLLLSHCPNRGDHSHKLEQSVALAPHGNVSPAETLELALGQESPGKVIWPGWWQCLAGTLGSHAGAGLMHSLPQ